MLIAHVSNNKYGIGEVLERERLQFTVCWVQRIAKLKGRGPTIAEVWPNHVIRSSVAITKLPLGHDILTEKKNNNKKKQKRDFLKITFLWIFKLSGLVYSTYNFQEHSK